MGNYSFVLSDELQKEFCNFKEGKAYDRNLIENLLHYYKPSILTNTSQLKRIGKDISKQLETTLRKSGFTTQSLEDLAQNTTYKIILCKDKDHYPYVNINGDKIENNLTACFFKRENRQKAIEHITALCRKAKNISIYDKYIIRKSKFPQNPKRSVRFSGKRTKRSVQKRKARNTQKAETKVL